MRNLILTINFLIERAEALKGDHWAVNTVEDRAETFRNESTWNNCKAFAVELFETQCYSSAYEKQRGRYNSFKYWMQGLCPFSPIGECETLEAMTSEPNSGDYMDREEEFILNAYKVLFDEVPTNGEYLAECFNLLDDSDKLAMLAEFGERNHWNVFFFENEPERILEELGADYSPVSAFEEIYAGAKSGDYNACDSYAFIDDNGHLVSFSDPIEFFGCEIIDLIRDIERSPEDYSEKLAELVDLTGEPFSYSIIQDCLLLHSDGSVARDLMVGADAEQFSTNDPIEAINVYYDLMSKSPVDLPKRLEKGYRIELTTYIEGRDIEDYLIIDNLFNGFSRNKVIKSNE